MFKIDDMENELPSTVNKEGRDKILLLTEEYEQ
jgi:hypothetical protein